MAHQDKENYTVILNSKNRIGTSYSSTDDANYYFDWSSAMPEGQYKMTYSLCKQLYVTPLNALLAAKPAWAIYDAKNFNSTNQLLIDSSPNGRHATCTACSLLSSIGNGSTANIKSIVGTVVLNSNVLFPAGSIPPNFTIFSLSRYTNASGNKNRILTGTGAGGDAGNFILGHSNGSYPTCFNYNTFTSLFGTFSNTNFCNLGFSSASTSPNNIIFEGDVGVGNGNRNTSGIVTCPLSVNLFPTERSDFALSQVIIWDRELTTEEMKIVSASFTFYLKNGYY
jgi:hypothetical protein